MLRRARDLQFGLRDRRPAGEHAPMLSPAIRHATASAAIQTRNFAVLPLLVSRVVAGRSNIPPPFDKGRV